MSKDYTNGYAVGYIAAVREFTDQLTFDDETGVIRLSTLLNWLEDKEHYYVDIRRKLLEQEEKK